LWREDAYSLDRGNPQWTSEPSGPLTYSESENAPLRLQISPPPANAGTLEALTVDSLTLDLANPAQTFNIPDEWAHALKYATLSDLFSTESQNTDPLRAQYAEMRYQQSRVIAADARSIMRVLSNNVPLALDSLQALDAGGPYWRNQSGPPQFCAGLYDMLVLSPGQVASPTGLGIDVVQSAPIPATGSEYIPLGAEDLDNLLDYVTHILAFKCGGNEFKQTFSGYDGFVEAAADRGRINAAKIRYLVPLFGTPQREWAARPDRMEVAK